MSEADTLAQRAVEGDQQTLPAARCRRHRPLAASEDIDWESTLSHPDNVQPCAQPPSLRTLVRLQQPTDTGAAVLIMLDASASVRTGHRFAQARQAVAHLVHRTARMGRRVALLYFQGNAATWLAQGERCATRALARLNQLIPAGGTPLSTALHQAGQWVKQWHRHYPHAHIRSWLFTDARYQWSIMPRWNTPLTLVDTELGQGRLGRGPSLAQSLNAHYLPLSAMMT